jgi:hypothetical protein
MLGVSARTSINSRQQTWLTELVTLEKADSVIVCMKLIDECVPTSDVSRFLLALIFGV